MYDSTVHPFKVGNSGRDFPDVPMVKTLHLHRRAAQGFDRWSGELRSWYAVQHGQNK